MATFTDNGGGAPNGSDLEFTYTFPVIQTEDVKVSLNGVTQATTKYTVDNVSNPTKITFNNTSVDSSVQETSGAPKSGVRVRVYRETTVGKANGDEDPKAVFAAGSSIRAIDLNANQEQALMAIHELQTRPIETEDLQINSITGDKIADDSINSQHYVAGSIDLEHMSANSVDSDQYVDGSIDHVHLANDCIDGDNIQNDSINSEHYVDLSIDTQHIANENVTTSKLAPDAVTSAKLADNAVDSEHYVDGSVDHVHLANDAVDGDNIADDSINSEHYVAGSIDHEHLANDIIDGTNIQDSVINSEHYVDGSIDRVHLAADIVDGTKIADDAIGAEHIQANAVTDSEIATGTLDNRYFTETELTSGALDGRYFTETESDARYFNVSTGDTIKDGDTFPDNDTTIATTAAINDRIIDLVDDVGGFVPIANETSFPTANPDVNDGAGTIVSVKAASTGLTAQSGTTLTIANGAGTGNTVTITGLSVTIPSGFGFLVETTSTLHTYAFHRLVPKATEVTTVAGISSNVTTVATNIANINTVAADLNEGTSEIDTVATNIANVNTVGNAIANVNTTAGSIANVNTTAGSISNVNNVGNNISNVNSVAGNESNINSAVSNASNINSAVSNASNINTVAGSISNVNTAATNIASINTAASNITNVNNFTDRYQIASSDPSTDGGGNALADGDLYFNTSANELKVYNGSTWQGGVTASGSFASTTGNTFSGDNIYNDNVKAKFGTGSDLEIYHSGTDTYIDNDTGVLRINSDNIYLKDKDGGDMFIKCIHDGAVELNHNGSKKVETTSSGVTVTGNITVSGNVDGRDVSADGTKLDGIEASATADQTASEIVSLLSDQNISTTGTLASGNLTITSTQPFLSLQDSDNENDFEVGNAGGTFRVRDVDAGVNRLTIDSNGNVQIPNDSGKLELGASQDLEIYHNGSHSYISDTGTGNLRLIGNGNVDIMNAEADEYKAKFITNGAVELYYDNAKKFETSSAGAQLSGHLQLVGHLDMDDNHQIKLGSDDDFKIHHDGTNNFLETTGADIIIYGSGEDLAKFKDDGAVELYHNGVKKCETASYGLSVSGNISLGDDNGGDTLRRLVVGSGNDLIVYHDGSNSYITEQGTGDLYVTSTGGNINLQTNSDEPAVKCIQNGAVELYHDNSKKLETTSSGATITGTVTATTFSGNATSATQATQLANARTIAGTSFNGTANIDISYNNLTNKPTIPTNISQLNNNSGYINTISGQNYNLLSNKPTIPTNNNQLSNGAGYITSVSGQNYNSLSNKPTIPSNNNQLSNGAGYLTSSSSRVAQAWVNFRGNSSVTIRDHANMNSVTDLSIGNYRVNFQVSMPDSNYCIATGYLTTTGNANALKVQSQSTGSFDIKSGAYQNGSGNSALDFEAIYCAIFAD